MSGYTFHIVKDWPLEALVPLYEGAGWWRESPGERASVPRLVAGSYCFMVATADSDGRTVAMGRALSDGASDAYIQDVAVLPDFRGRGIGRDLIRRLVEYCRAAGITWIGLVGEPGTAGFYEGLGFREMAGYLPLRFPTPERP